MGYICQEWVHKGTKAALPHLKALSGTNIHYLNSRVLLSKALLRRDRLLEEMWCSQQISAQERSSRAYVKIQPQISEGTYNT